MSAASRAKISKAAKLRWGAGKEGQELRPFSASIPVDAARPERKCRSISPFASPAAIASCDRGPAAGRRRS
jgi:hypothetical protein